MKKENSETKVKTRKIVYVIRVLIIFLICLVSLPGICYLIVHNVGDEPYIYVELKDEMNNLEKRDAVIVPGAGIAVGMPNAIGRDRLDAAITVYEQEAANLIIVSGGTKEEVQIMAEYLMKKGIPRESIAVDEYGSNTYNTLARIEEKYKFNSYYFCTQEMYAARSCYLMKQVDMGGKIICVDTMYYSISGKTKIREFFAATKAVFESIFYGGSANTSIEEADFGKVPEYKESMDDDTHISVEELETPEDCVVTDINEKDNYNVE